MKVDPGVHDTVSIRCPETYRFSTYTSDRAVITRWSGSTSRMRAIGEARYANLLSRTRLIAVSVVFWWVGNLYDVFIGVVVYRGVLVKWNKQK